MRKKFGILLGMLALLFMACLPMKVTAENQKTHFMVYYRAWRDQAMKGVNTTLPDDNWLTMDQIPYGIDIVNVFSFVPQGEEAAAAPFFQKLKTHYVPVLHQRGVKLTKAIDYSELLKVPHKGAFPTAAEFDAYANQLLDEHVRPYGIDGLDIDMEANPSKEAVALSDGVIKALSKYIGPLANNQTVFVYDTNGSYLEPFKNVANCFTYLGYQQYGSGSERTANALKTYEGVIPKERFMPGLTFPEELDHNYWYDTKEPYEDSNLYHVAKYTAEHQLYGMFLYALDRDGRTYAAEDLNHIKPSNFLWTKTAILEAKGYTLTQAKEIAKHHWNRVAPAGEFKEQILARINQATSIYEVNKVLLGSSNNFEEDGVSLTYDPIYELTLMNK